jgi:hypothetical protein
MLHRNLALLFTIAFAMPAVASTTVCVTDVSSFQTALDNAVNSTSSTFIEVARGTYHLGGTPLTFDSSAVGQGQLDLTGGFDSDCSTNIDNPALTVIDADALSVVMSLSSENGISVRYLTVQNGSKTSGTESPAGLSVESQSGGIIVDYNIVRGNSGSTAAGVKVRLASGSNDVHFDGNMIVNNTGNGDSVAGFVSGPASGKTYFTNNTIAGNVSTNQTAGIGGGITVVGSGDTLATFVSNTVAWGNSGYDLSVCCNDVLVDSDIGVIAGGYDSGHSSGNVSVDPQFSSATDFHLLPTSPLLGQGTLTPAGNLPTIDIEGHPRSYNGLVDMGAYERGDEIYGYGFDN